MIPIFYMIGDATRPAPRVASASLNIIAHVCNDVGAWGAGFVVALSARDTRPENTYRAWHTNRAKPGSWHRDKFELGQIELVPFCDGAYVCNMIAQKGTFATGNPLRLSYTALASCLNKLGLIARRFVGSKVHLPRIGCGLAGGTWDRVEPLVQQFLSSRDIPVNVYDLAMPAVSDYQQK